MCLKKSFFFSTGMILCSKLFFENYFCRGDIRDVLRSHFTRFLTMKKVTREKRGVGLYSGFWVNHQSSYNPMGLKAMFYGRGCTTVIQRLSAHPHNFGASFLSSTVNMLDVNTIIRKTRSRSVYWYHFLCP